jgi:hypothetical protein
MSSLLIDIDYLFNIVWSDTYYTDNKVNYTKSIDLNAINNGDEVSISNHGNIVQDIKIKSINLKKNFW